jgi:hypothetical protein
MRPLQRFHVVQAAPEEDGGGDDEHRDVDQAREGHRDQHVDPRVPVQRLRLRVVLRDDPLLRERRMEVDDVRHHRCAEDPDREEHRLVALEVRNDGVLRDLSERRVREPELAEVADSDHEDERGDDRLERTESVALQPEDRERDHARDHRCREEGDVEEEMDPDRGAQELRQIGRHRDHLGLDPEADRRPPREPLAAHFGQVSAGRDPELRRQRLDQHRHQVRRDDHPDEREPELRPPGDVRREVPRVHVGDAGDERRPEKRPDAPPAAAERLLTGAREPRDLLGSRRHHRES